MDRLNAVFLLGTLKRRGQLSNTATLCEILAESLKKHGVRSEIVHLVEHDIKPGTRSNMGRGDAWPAILRQIVKAEIVVFATPIWWGIHSSETQRVIERMDELNDDLLAEGESKLSNKVAGIVITGAEDGAEHVIGNLANFCVSNGMMLPPGAAVSWLGDPGKAAKARLKRKLRGDCGAMVETAARNLAFVARLLARQPIPKSETESG
jgi:multimeric flavodoxin WrbA